MRLGSFSLRVFLLGAVDFAAAGAAVLPAGAGLRAVFGFIAGFAVPFFIVEAAIVPPVSGKSDGVYALYENIINASATAPPPNNAAASENTTSILTSLHLLNSK